MSFLLSSLHLSALYLHSWLIPGEQVLPACSPSWEQQSDSERSGLSSVPQTLPHGQRFPGCSCLLTSGQGQRQPSTPSHLQLGAGYMQSGKTLDQEQKSNLFAGGRGFLTACSVYDHPLLPSTM